MADLDSDARSWNSLGARGRSGATSRYVCSPAPLALLNNTARRVHVDVIWLACRRDIVRARPWLLTSMQSSLHQLCHYQPATDLRPDGRGSFVRIRLSPPDNDKYVTSFDRRLPARLGAAEVETMDAHRGAHRGRPAGEHLQPVGRLADRGVRRRSADWDSPAYWGGLHQTARLPGSVKHPCGSRRGRHRRSPWRRYL